MILSTICGEKRVFLFLEGQIVMCCLTCDILVGLGIEDEQYSYSVVSL